MISIQQQQLFKSHFPFIKKCSPEFVETFFHNVQFMQLPAGVSICDEGQQCAHLAMVIDGVGRVYKLSPSGREITLYRIHGGESCVLTASCIMSQNVFPAMAATETPVTAILVSPGNVREWFCKDQEWQKFIFGLLSFRLNDIISVVEEVAFKRIDVRIAEQLVRHIGYGNRLIQKTHAELAADVGSSREVISRILKDFAERGLVNMTRGSIEVVDLESIQHLSRL
jgi:CRP/FNR family transcriptional regulator, anaerobic regulatory protein